MNKVILLGNLTKDPELSYTAGKGTPVCKLSIAVRRDKENSDFINCVAWNKNAELIASNFVKGSKIAVTGSIKTGSYEAKDGTKRYTTDVWIETFEFVESKKKEDVASSNNTGGFVGFDDDMTPVNDGDIPF
jgi:single-strand DNA-binding protein